MKKSSFCYQFSFFIMLLSPIITKGQIVSTNGIEYKIDKTNKTASVSKANASIIFANIQHYVLYKNTSYIVTEIEDKAFEGCTKLKKISITKNITSIGITPFSSCKSLETIKVSVNNKKYCSVNGILYNKEKSTLICCPESEKIIIDIPNTVTSIADYAFYNHSSIKTITLPNSITNIGQSAFQGCSSLTSVTLPNSITDIGQSAFKGCI